MASTGFSAVSAGLGGRGGRRARKVRTTRWIRQAAVETSELTGRRVTDRRWDGTPGDLPLPDAPGGRSIVPRPLSVPQLLSAVEDSKPPVKGSGDS